MQKIEDKKQIIWPIILLLFTSTDTVLFGTNANRLFVYVPRIMALIMCVVIPGIKRDSKLRDIRTLLITVILTSITILSGLINKAGIFTIISRVLPILIAFTIAEHYSINSYVKVFDKFLYLITIIALVFHVVAIIMPNAVLSLPSIANENGITYRTIIISSVIQFNNIGRSIFTRLSGPFWEPGAYAIYLCIGLMFQLFFVEIQSVKKIIIYVIALLLTYSTTGYVAFAVLLIAFFVQKRNFRNDRIKVGILALLCLIAVFGVFGAESALTDMVFGKIVNKDPTTNVRLSSLISGMRIAIDHPWLGVGGLAGQYMSDYARLYGFGSSSILANTFVHQFANYGFVFGIIFAVESCKFYIKQFDASKAIGALLFVVLLLLYMGEALFSFLPFVFVMYGSSRIQWIEEQHE